VGVFDSDKLDVFHLGVFPLKSDTPRGLAGIGIDRVSGAAFELVVVEEGHEQEGFFIGFVEDGEPLEGFDGVEASQFVDFLAVEFLTEKELFRCHVRKTLDHGRKNTPKGERGEVKDPVFCSSDVHGCGIFNQTSRAW
jgi:hypothetical protein